MALGLLEQQHLGTAGVEGVNSAATRSYTQGSSSHERRNVLCNTALWKAARAQVRNNSSKPQSISRRFV